MDPKTKELLTNEVFSFNPRKDDFEYYGRGHLFDRIAEQQNISDKELLEEFERRKKVITWMKEKGIRHYLQVGEIISAYYKYPDEVIKRMEA
jgi:flagellar protein FlaI